MGSRRVGHRNGVWTKIRTWKAGFGTDTPLVGDSMLSCRFRFFFSFFFPLLPLLLATWAYTLRIPSCCRLSRLRGEADARALNFLALIIYTLCFLNLEACD